MFYVVLLVVLATAGIVRLWLQQRKERSHLQTVNGFRSSLQVIAAGPSVRPAARDNRPVSRPVATPRTGKRPQPMDPARRDAAKRRLEARRRERSRSSF